MVLRNIVRAARTFLLTLCSRTSRAEMSPHKHTQEKKKDLNPTQKK